MSIPMYQLGWMAGILDMKGVIIGKKNKQRATPQLVLMVETKQVEVIRGLSAMTGTSPDFQPAKDVEEWMRRGCVDHCPEKHVHVGHDYPKQMPATARWTVTGAAMAVVLHNVLPFVRNDQWFH